MSAGPTTITPLATYRNESPYPFCPGCGHTVILNHLNEAFRLLDRDPREIVLVSDIGCAGLSDQYFATSAFHGLHGRSVTYACGIKLARPELDVLVVMGDGGTGIGGTHLINAARRNIGITVLVFNNLNFGMTGGQHSTTTPAGAVTSTTTAGNLERPLDVAATAAVNGAGYVYRGTSFDKDLPARIAEAVRAPGFAILDIWELCTAYYVRGNQFSRQALFATLDELGFATGVVRHEEVADYGAAYRAANPPRPDSPSLPPKGLEPRFAAALARRFELVVAGSAGQKVRTAVRLASEAAILSGLAASQRDDYPVTVQTGHSLSAQILSPEPIEYTGVETPDALLVLSTDGLKKVGRHLAAMGEDGRVFAVPELGELPTRAPVTPIDLSRAPGKLNRSLAALAAVLGALGLLPKEALEEAARLGPEEYRAGNLAAIAAGWSLASGL
ncbi:MAG: thiamine pyrophosphate-dependent enzyme [Acidobacteriota bacterium]|nr:thiamine pyrophosphate-dependent enzyme [Acidobacteriota bacterium]MDH3523317.1 thiamine pyrophosphate-dependent enzyme [Acidobacteriota bacterium]